MTNRKSGSRRTCIIALTQNRSERKGATHLVLQVNGEVGFKRLIPHFAGKAEKEMTELWQETTQGTPRPSNNSRNRHAFTEQRGGR